MKQNEEAWVVMQSKSATTLQNLYCCLRKWHLIRRRAQEDLQKRVSKRKSEEFTY